MRKAARKNKPSKKQIEPHEQGVVSPPKQQGKKHLLTLVIIAILAAIPFSMGKYFEFNSPGPFDSGAYIYSAKHILDGAKIGVDEKPSARIGTLLVNMLGVWLCGFNEIGPKLMQTLFQAVALVFMFIAMRKLFGVLPAAVGTIVASVYLSAPLIAKFGNVKEQYMITCTVMGVSCFVLHQLGGRWWYAMLAGAFLIWASLFKETGVSAIGAIGLFVVLQPIMKNRTWKQTGYDILFLLAGAVISIGPVYLWLAIINAPFGYWPYAKLWRLLFPGEGQRVGSYISKSRQMLPFLKLAPRVFRYYGLLILPIALAASSIIIRIVKLISSKLSKSKSDRKTIYDRFVLLFAVWWLLDMAFVWISPRSYEQYYLPLNASAAMLGGYLIAIYCDRFKAAVFKTKWMITGLGGVLLMVIMSWHIFFGIEKSPHSGASYGEKRRGYAQKLHEVSQRRKHNFKGPWEAVGEYIGVHSKPTDKIYVWGWFPGIYVKAQRLSAAVHAFTSEMHVRPPEAVSEMVAEILADFEGEKPKFIVDTHKKHFPWNRPPLELWPIVPKGFMGVKETQFLPSENNTMIEAFDRTWSGMLRQRYDEDEALRYEAMKPFREYIMKNYKIVRPFGQHVLFERK